MTINPVSFTRLSTPDDWPMVRRQMILNEQEHVCLTVEQMDSLLQSYAPIVSMQEIIKELTSTLAEVHRLTAP